MYEEPYQWIGPVDNRRPVRKRLKLCSEFKVVRHA